MKAIFIALIILFLLFQYRLWFGDDGLVQAWRLHKTVTQQQANNDETAKRNARLTTEITELKKGGAAIENRARNDLGMVKKGETFYQIVK